MQSHCFIGRRFVEGVRPVCSPLALVALSAWAICRVRRLRDGDRRKPSRRMDDDRHGSRRAGRRARIQHRRLRLLGACRLRARLFQAGPRERGANDRRLLARDPALCRLEVARVDPLATGCGRCSSAVRRRCPLGVWLLVRLDASMFAAGLGVFLVAYGGSRLMRRETRVVRGGAWTAVVAGALGGLTGGLAGLPGPRVTIWCSRRGWDKQQQRAVYQPYILVMQALTLVCAALAGADPTCRRRRT